MCSLALTALIGCRVPLSAREAATLTLAVAREWERARALRGGPVSLPGADAIQLANNGAVSFLSTPTSSRTDDFTPLATLFAQLVALGELQKPPQPIPAELLIMMAEIQLPSTTPQRFRTALEALADGDATILSALFWRAASTARKPRMQGSPDMRPASGGKQDRRRVPEAVTELRRTVRQLEQQTFQYQERLAVTPVQRRRPFTTDAVSGIRIAACALAFTVAGMIMAPRSHVARPAPIITELAVRTTASKAAAAVFPRPASSARANSLPGASSF